MDNYIYQNNFSIPKLLCDEIIEKYEKYHIFHYQGVTFGGLEKKIKDTTDFIIPNCENEKDDWYKSSLLIAKKLIKDISKISKEFSSIKQPSWSSIFYVRGDRNVMDNIAELYKRANDIQKDLIADGGFI